MCKRPQNLYLLLSLALTLAAPASLAASFWDEDVWNSEDRGFLYYPPEELKKKVPDPNAPKDLSLILSAAELRAEYTKRLENATFLPTEANVLAFQEVNHFVQEKAALFTDMNRRVSWQNLNPAANFAQVSLKEDRNQTRKEQIPQIAQDWGLMYFYRSDCRFCALQSPLVKQLKETLGFEVLAVSLDGSSNDHSPDALPDNGVSKLLTNGLGLDRVPALFMVKRDHSASYLVSSGVLSLEDMLSRIQTLALSKPGESLFGGAQAANSVQKTTNFSTSDAFTNSVLTTLGAPPSL
jgi:conjugal transfer pilus assembly protein TraF